MNDNNNILGNHNRINEEDDQLRPNTMNETIREVNGDADIDSNVQRTGGTESSRNAGGHSGADLTGGSTWSPNDASSVRSGGTTDMDDQTARGAGLEIGSRSGSHMAPKTTVTGSDFDGQNATS